MQLWFMPFEGGATVRVVGSLDYGCPSASSQVVEITKYGDLSSWGIDRFVPLIAYDLDSYGCDPSLIRLLSRRLSMLIQHWREDIDGVELHYGFVNDGEAPDNGGDVSLS